MWVAEVIGREDQVLRSFLLRAGVGECLVGRDPTCTISFPAEKGMSRKHAVITIEASADNTYSDSCEDASGQSVTLAVRDSGSTYGTKVGERMLRKDDQLVITESGTIARFGSVQARVRFVQRQFNICFTRVDRSLRQKVTQHLLVIGGSVVNAVVDPLRAFQATATATASSVSAVVATHLVTQQCTPTEKLLAAIAFRVPVVHPQWLQQLAADVAAADAAGVSAAVLVSEGQFPALPAHDGAKAIAFEADRGQLLAGFYVFITSGDDVSGKNCLLFSIPFRLSPFLTLYYCFTCSRMFMQLSSNASERRYIDWYYSPSTALTMQRSSYSYSYTVRQYMIYFSHAHRCYIYIMQHAVGGRRTAARPTAEYIQQHIATVKAGLTAADVEQLQFCVFHDESRCRTAQVRRTLLHR